MNGAQGIVKLQNEIAFLSKERRALANKDDFEGAVQITTQIKEAQDKIDQLKFGGEHAPNTSSSPPTQASELAHLQHSGPVDLSAITQAVGGPFEVPPIDVNLARDPQLHDGPSSPGGSQGKGRHARTPSGLAFPPPRRRRKSSLKENQALPPTHPGSPHAAQSPLRSSVHSDTLPGLESGFASQRRSASPTRRATYHAHSISSPPKRVDHLFEEMKGHDSQKRSSFGSRFKNLRKSKSGFAHHRHSQLARQLSAPLPEEDFEDPGGIPPTFEDDEDDQQPQQSEYRPNNSKQDQVPRFARANTAPMGIVPTSKTLHHKSVSINFTPSTEYAPQIVSRTKVLDDDSLEIQILFEKPKDRERIGIECKDGGSILRVQPGSLADLKGVQADWVLISVDGSKAKKKHKKIAKQIDKALRTGSVYLAFIQKGRKYRVTLDGISYRTTPRFQDNVDPERGVSHGQLVVAINIQGNWIQTEDQYWLPRIIDGNEVLEKFQI